jgi:hypothetical protein
VAYELETIETKITEHIFLASSDSITFDAPQFLKELDSECVKVKKAFRNQVLSFEAEELVKRYFHFHQESLIDLINNIQYSAQLSGTEGLAESVIRKLTDLLAYLEEHFPEYFDQDMKMPTVRMTLIRDELRTFDAFLSEKFGYSNIDIGLIQIVKNAIEASLSKGKAMSFRAFYYFKYLRIQIANFNLEDDTESIDLIKLLMHCNFNHETFYNYLVKYVRWSVDKVSLLNEKLEVLAFYLKFANQETSITSLACSHSKPPINIQIADWVAQEVHYIKQKQQLAAENLSADISLEAFKLDFDLSVSSVAYLFRAFTETGVIQNKNVSELIRFLTKYVRTKRSESISYESFRVKYYAVESGTKNAVKKALESLLHYINKN